MKINKKIFISILLVFVMLCVISNASAEDTNIDENLTMSDTDDVSLEEDDSQDTLVVSDSEEKISEGNVITVEGGGSGKISAAINSASSGDTIFIKNGEYSESAKITLTKSLNFVGESQDGVFITLSATNTLFEMIGSGVVLSFNQLTFNNINSGTGSNVPIKIGGDSNVDIINCSFIGCSSKFGVMQLYTTGTATVSDCTIQDFKSTASGGTGGIYLSGNGNYEIKNTVIDNSQYTVSSGYMYGVIYVSGKTSVTTLDNVTISNCRGSASSVIYSKAKTTVKNSKIINNTVEKSTTGYQGESVFYTNYNSNNNPNAELISEQTIIADNVAPNAFVYANNANAKTTINYCNVQNNTIGTTFATTTGNFNFEYNYWGSNEAPQGITVTRYAIMNNQGNFVDDQGNSLAKEIPQITEETGPEPTVLDVIYVSDSEGSNDYEGSISSPVKTIAKAIELAQKGKIIILAGNYALTETLSVAKDLDIEGRGNVIISSASQIITSTAKLNLTNIKFDSAADMAGAVVSTNSDLNIDSCVFNANTESGSAIDITGGNTNIVNSVLLNPTGYALTASSTANVNANNNWWGNNSAANTQVPITAWIVMDASIDLTKIYEGDEVTISASFTKTNDGNDYAGTLPEFNVTFSAKNLNENVIVKNNEASVKYTVNADDEATVISGSQSIKIPLKLYEAPEIIYVNATNGVDTNDGDEAHPVQSIAKAIELAVKGKIVVLEGTYTIDNTLTVNNDLDITGQGTVVIDGNSKRILNNNANLNISNIQFTNGFDSSAVIVNNANLTLANTLFYSNVNLNGYGASVVRNNKKLTVVDSKFYENKMRYGNIYNNNGAELLIDSSEFYNNDVTTVTTVATGLALYSEGGNAVIENSKFYNNKGNFSVIYFLSKDSLSSTVVNNLTIDNCTFESNELVRYGVIYSQKANTTIKDSTFTNNIVKKTNSGTNGEGAAIYVTGEKVNVKTSVFKNNNADDSGKDIYVYAGELDISDSVLINGNGYSIEKTESATVNANDNWWGANTPNTPITVDRWIVMTVTSNDTEIETGDIINVTASFEKTNDGAEYAGDLPEVFDVTFTSTSGNLNELKTVKDKKAEVTYTVDVADKKITVTSDNAVENLPVHRILDIIYVSESGNDDNEGERDTPVKTISKALELAVKGQIIILEGTYKTDDLGSIYNDLTITGEGKVVIDAQNSNRILYVGTDAKVVLKNLIMINGFAADESGALLGNSNELTLINCTLANSTAGENNGGAIYNVGKLTIINSTIANNTASEGGAIFTNDALAKGSTITIENSIIENNIATGKDNFGGGAIFAQQLAGLTISNTTFENNEAQTTASGGAIFISHSTADMEITDSKFIANHANGQESTGGGAIYMTGTSNYERKGKLTISNTLFENNTADSNGGAIYSRATTVKVENSVLINNTDANGISVYGYQTEQIAPSITANKNWWGTNDKPSSFIGGNNKYKPTVSNWAILTINNDTEIKDGNTVKLTVAIDSYTDGETVTKLETPISMPVPVTISTNKGDINGVLTNGEFTYDLDATGIKFISAKADGVEEILFVDTTDVTISAENITASKGDNVEYTITITSADETVVNKGVVEIYFDQELVKTIDVVSGVAKDKIFINKDMGKYNITVKYIDSTAQFANDEINKTLTVSGINNVVTPETIDNFFDENGVLRDDVLDELIFKGEFKDLGILEFDKPVKIIGEGAVFNNTAISITGDDVSVSNIEFIADKQFSDNDGALIYIGGDNVILKDNNITYNAPDNVESHAITIDIADNVKISENMISYSAKSEGEVETIAFYAYEANNLVFENNKLDATIPSVPIGYVNYPDNDYYSQGVHVESSDNISFNKNDIKVKYNVFNGMDDTIYAVHVLGCDDSRITDNKIALDGHTYAYGLVTSDCDNLTISGNDIKANSDNHYAAGLQVGGDSSANVENNNISAKANDVTYPVYLDDWGEDGEVNLTNNNITGESDTVYGVYVEENKTNISNNTIDVDGNHVYGVVSHETDVVIDGNNITANGKDTGDIISPQSGVDYNTTGIIASKGSADIKNNNVITTGNSTIIAKDTNASVTNNGLSANGTTADNSITNINSDIKSSGNTEAKNKTDDKPVDPINPVDPVKPVAPVVQITAANNAKVFYSLGYTVRVTEDGKSVGAGKEVTLKIAGKTLTAKTNADGYATFKLAVKPKAYTVTAAYNGVTKTFKVTVKTVIKAKNLKVKKSAKILKVKVTLKAGKKAIKGKVVLKIKGKKIKAKTNKKGVATFKVKKNILKKLKAGKKYKYTVTYGKDTVKKTLKVKK